MPVATAATRAPRSETVRAVHSTSRLGATACRAGAAKRSLVERQVAVREGEGGLHVSERRSKQRLPAQNARVAADARGLCGLHGLHQQCGVISAVPAGVAKMLVAETPRAAQESVSCRDDLGQKSVYHALAWPPR